MADGVDDLVRQGVEVKRVLLVGGGAKSRALCEIAPAILGVPVVIPAPGEYVAEGACRQAAWALSGDTQPPVWPKPEERRFDAEPAPHVRERYASLRELTEGV